MSKYFKLTVLALVLGAAITAGTYAVASTKDTSPAPVKTVELALPQPTRKEISRGFPWAYYQSTETKSLSGFKDPVGFEWSVTHKTRIDYKAAVLDLLIWTSASFLVLFVVAQARRKHV